MFSRAISNDKKVEKEIKIQRGAVQLTDGSEQNMRASRGIPIPADEYAKVY